MRQFVAAGIPDKQAEVIVAALSRSDSELATKADLKQEVAGDMARVVTELQKGLDTAEHAAFIARLE